MKDTRRLLYPVYRIQGEDAVSRRRRCRIIVLVFVAGPAD
jgi:hypothetical protein